jgi:formylglycine-generating enzyme required for sulfatase activity
VKRFSAEAVKATWIVPLCVAGLTASCARKEQPGPSSGPQVITTSSGVSMAAIPGGWFEMGSKSGRELDETVHRVYVSPFYMDQFDVTQDQFQKVMGHNPSRWTDPRCPVEQIRWIDAAKYCNARSRLENLSACYDSATWKCDFAADGYRLPTEAEWEYACRAGSTTEYPFGDSPARLGEFAWFRENCPRSPQPVGSKPANAWGLSDMCGNVWQWCNDFYQEDYYRQSPERDPHGPETGLTRVLRGGCWNSRADKCRSAYRYYMDPGYSDACFGRDINGMIGFRCVKRGAAESSGR